MTTALSGHFFGSSMSLRAFDGERGMMPPTDPWQFFLRMLFYGVSGSRERYGISRMPYMSFSVAVEMTDFSGYFAVMPE